MFKRNEMATEIELKYLLLSSNEHNEAEIREVMKRLEEVIIELGGK